MSQSPPANETEKVTASSGVASAKVPPTTPSATQLPGTAGSNDIIVSTPANQTLTGQGNSDAFVFKSNFGHDTSTNFKPGNDVIQMDHTVFADLTHVLDATHDVAGHAVIPADAHNNIALNDVIKNQLPQHPGDFHHF